jgi:hypothetical protein
MRITITTGFIVLAFLSLSQELTSAEIKKLKIKKIAVGTMMKGALVDGRHEVFYDANGNDTAVYIDGKKAGFKKIEYNKKNAPARIIAYDKEGKITSVSTYTYKADGSYSISNKDAEFGLQNIYSHDKTGRLLQLQLPDGSVIKYVYSAGRLVKRYSVSQKDGTRLMDIFTYDKKGKLAKQESSGEYPSSTTFEYDNSGLLKKMITVSEGESYVQEYAYAY